MAGKRKGEPVGKLAMQLLCVMRHDRRDTVPGLITSLELEFLDVKDWLDYPEDKRARRNVIRRALQAMMRRGLVCEDGVSEVTSGNSPTMDGFDEPASGFAGKYVPKGYTRIAKVYALTSEGEALAAQLWPPPTPEQKAAMDARWADATKIWNAPAEN